jgi:glucosamine--fructose-6-phosphate aminotransferase (isomerizing)
MIGTCFYLKSGNLEIKARTFKDNYNALFLECGPMHAIAMKGTLKFKEISYIHAEAFSAVSLNTAQLH